MTEINIIMENTINAIYVMENCYVVILNSNLKWVLNAYV